MKKFAFFVVLFASVFSISCSEDNGSNPPQTVDDTDYFNFVFDGVDVPIESWTAVRSEDNFEVVGEAEDGRSMFFSFNAMGNLARATATPPMSPDFNWLHSYYHYTANYFDFNIVAIDETNKIIKVTYSGNLYENEFDLNSQSTPVEGSFNVHYTEIPPQIPGLGLSSVINGTEWHSVKSGTTISNGTDYTLEFNSDDAYLISLHFAEGVAAGTYSFDPSSETRVMLSRFDIALGTYIEYFSTGTFTISDIASEGPMSMMSGTFSFTAVHPVTSAEVEVTNGTFKTVFSN